MSDLAPEGIGTVLGFRTPEADFSRPACILSICRTCPRADRPARVRRGDLAQNAGVALAAALKALLAPADNVTLRQVECLSGCLGPCNARLSAPGKIWLRFNSLAPKDARAIVAFAVQYSQSLDGEIAPSAWPPVLRAKFAAAMPPYGLPEQGGLQRRA